MASTSRLTQFSFPPEPPPPPPPPFSHSDGTNGSNFYYEQIKMMFNNELYSNLLTFVWTERIAQFETSSSWVLGLAQNQPELLSESQQCHVYGLNGDAAFALGDFHRAETHYRRALQLYKYLLKSSPNWTLKLQLECGTSNNIKYKIHLCLVQCKNTRDALKMLESIPASQRNVKIHMAMGNLNGQTGMKRAAIASYKEVVRICPMSLDAVEQLLLLGCSEDDIQSLVRDKTTKSVSHPDWYNSWISGTAAMAARDNQTSMKIFKGIREKHNLPMCVPLLHSLGVACSNYGDYAAAIGAFKLASQADPTNSKGMDLYAFLLWHENMQPELYKLMMELTETNQNEAKYESWVATAYHLLSTDRYKRAELFAEKGSSFLGAKNPEGLIAHGHVFLKQKKYQDAVECFREVMARVPERFEPHRGIVECYMAMDRGREAINVAIGALKTVGNTPRVLNLCATALKKDKDPLTLTRAKTYLEKALKIDNSFLPALLAFVDILEYEGKHNEGIQMIKSYMRFHACVPKLYVRLAELLSRIGKSDQAADNYAIALRFDPSNSEAQEELDRLDPTSSRGNAGVGDIKAEMEDVGLEVEEEEDESYFPLSHIWSNSCSVPGSDASTSPASLPDEDVDYLETPQ